MIIKRTRLVLAALLVTLGYASAAYGLTLTFRPVPGENISFLSEGPLTLEIGANRVSCQITLSGTISESSFNMTEGTAFGSINGSGVSGCSGGSLSFLGLPEGPSSMTYRSFLGTLPSMTAIRHRFAALRIQATGIFGTCLYTGDVDALMELRDVDEWIVGTSTIAVGRLALTAGALCPGVATLSGRLALQNMLVANNPIMKWNPSGFNYGNVRVGESRETISRFENISGVQIEITEVRTRGTGCASHSFTTGGGALAAGRNLGAGGRIEITATFEPTGVGQRLCDYEVRARTAGGAVMQRSFVSNGRGI